MTAKKTPPPELIESRPVLDGDPTVVHPSMGLPLGGPPRKYTRAVHDVIVTELKKGQRPQGACARAGITLATFHDWIKRGKEGDPWLYEFAQDVEIAYNSAEANVVDKLASAMDDEDTKIGLDAVKFWLERQRADGYSKQVKTLVDKQIEQFVVRLEKALIGMPARMITGEQIFELVLAVYLGQAPAAELAATKEVVLLPEHESESSS